MTYESIKVMLWRIYYKIFTDKLNEMEWREVPLKLREVNKGEENIECKNQRKMKK